MKESQKKWGEEVILHNDSEYCGKLLRFNGGAKFSMHFHAINNETWCINHGHFELHFIDTKTTEKHIVSLIQGMVVDVERFSPHQLIALTDGEIFEMSTQHFDDDSYRIGRGDSQI